MASKEKRGRGFTKPRFEMERRLGVSSRSRYSALARPCQSTELSSGEEKAVPDTVQADEDHSPHPVMCSVGQQSGPLDRADDAIHRYCLARRQLIRLLRRCR
jgi:hypothetical protein